MTTKELERQVAFGYLDAATAALREAQGQVKGAMRWANEAEQLAVRNELAHALIDIESLREEIAELQERMKKEEG